MLPLGVEVSERCSAHPNVAQPADSADEKPHCSDQRALGDKGSQFKQGGFLASREETPAAYRLLFPVFAQIEELNSEIEVLSAAWAKPERPQKRRPRNSGKCWLCLKWSCLHP